MTKVYIIDKSTNASSIDTLVTWGR